MTIQDDINDRISFTPSTVAPIINAISNFNETTLNSNVNTAKSVKDGTSTTSYTQLPIARVKKIMKIDESIVKLSSDAAFTCGNFISNFINLQ